MRVRIADMPRPSVTAGSTRCAGPPRSRHRQPAEVDREDDDQHRPEPEVRDRHADEAEAVSDARSRTAVRARSAQRAERNGEPSAMATAPKASVATPDIARRRAANRTAVVDRAAEIAAREAGEETRRTARAAGGRARGGAGARRGRAESAVSPSMTSTGSPGMTWSSRNTTVATPRPGDDNRRRRVAYSSTSRVSRLGPDKLGG